MMIILDVLTRATVKRKNLVWTLAIALEIEHGVKPEKLFGNIQIQTITVNGLAAV